ncbi:hypothetical protein HGM15179_020345 [Zosterops borbonicus]|uniref:Reverse transcriptase n=1 Tax=Zosterops borbonicus TaxID=364589 RepID=A0A8K1D9D1_9PASS|nr:hypothetical protein HGM15179_020345 [Zosterops borbonicus]
MPLELIVMVKELRFGPTIACTLRRDRDRIQEHNNRLRWKTLEEKIQQLREVAVFEVLFGKTRQHDNDPDKVEVQQVPVATSKVPCQQNGTNRDAVIPIHKMIQELESQGVINKTHSPFNSPIWPVRKSDGE